MIQQFADWLIYSLLGLSANTPLGSSLNFFVYDSIKIVLLLFLISAIMGVVNAYFPIERLRITVVYVVSGILLGMVGGFLLGRLRLESYLSDWVKQIQQNASADFSTWEKERTPFMKRLPSILREAWGIVKGVLLYILIGIGIGAVMHGYVPEGFFEQYMSRDNVWAVPLSVLLAVPLYANAAGIVPIVEVFVAKGIPIGTVLAFMMAVVGLSLPEATLLKKVMTWRLIGIFFGIITLFIILSGYLFNAIL
ncbi:permease [Barnesiella viscericola DSM 18177]|uniref:Permease n=1 Tax=Barnesiella viscericola DSM 18177 TaxID=880074 RepID=W0EU06_9BACT|nr:permease [Barnesiella viscericola]AHF13038.1 permease [Barnesiella viscericola DSM 18177]